MSELHCPSLAMTEIDPDTTRLASDQADPPLPAPCPVALLASRAATLLRAHYALMDPDDAPDIAPPFEMPKLSGGVAGDDRPLPETIRKNLYDEIYAIAAFAAFQTATSRKGAMFQLYLAANEAGWLTTKLYRPSIPDKDLRIIEKSEDRCKKLIHSALRVVDIETDKDLKLLRRWFFSAAWEDEVHGSFVLAELEATAAV